MEVPSFRPVGGLSHRPINYVHNFKLESGFRALDCSSVLGGSLVGFRVGGNARPLSKKACIYKNVNVLMIRSITIP